MKSSLYTILATLAIGAVGCGGSSTKKPTNDAGPITSKDMAMPPTSQCITIDNFATMNSTLGGQVVFANFYTAADGNIPMGADYADEMYGVRPNDDDDSAYDIMFYAAIHKEGDPAFSVPLAQTYTSASTPFDPVGIQYLQGCTAGTGGITCSNATIFGPQSGSSNATKLDGAVGGQMAVTGTDVHLVEWQQDTTGMTAGMPAPNGACIDVKAFDWTATLRGSSTGADM